MLFSALWELDWTIKPMPFYVKHASFSGKVSDLYQGQIVGGQNR